MLIQSCLYNIGIMARKNTPKRTDPGKETQGTEARQAAQGARLHPGGDSRTRGHHSGARFGLRAGQTAVECGYGRAVRHRPGDHDRRAAQAEWKRDSVAAETQPANVAKTGKNRKPAGTPADHASQNHRHFPQRRGAFKVRSCKCSGFCCFFLSGRFRGLFLPVTALLRGKTGSYLYIIQCFAVVRPPTPMYRVRGIVLQIAQAEGVQGVMEFIEKLQMRARQGPG